MTGSETTLAGPNVVESGSRSRGSRSHRACGNCSKIKEKCVISEDNSIAKCKRCHRLQKDCVFPAPRKRQRVEEASKPAYPTPTPSESVSLTDTLGPGERRDFLNSVSYAGLNSAQDESRIVSEGLEQLPNAQKESLYADFLRDLNPYLPLLVLDEECANAVSCEQNAPITFAVCIAAALHRHPGLQRRVSKEILSHVATSMFLGGRKSMDILRGLNILIAWYMYHVQRNPQLTNLIFLVKALLVDLGLSVFRHDNMTSCAEISGLPIIIHGPGITKDNKGLRGIRALLMSWYANAQIAISFRRLQYPRWSEHLESCLQKLQAANACSSDIQGAHVVRLYQTVERYLGPDGVRPSINLPIRSYVRCFRDDLQRIRTSLPQCVASNPHFELHLQFVELALYNSVTDAECEQPAQMLEALHALLARVNTYFDLYLSQPTEIFPFLPFLHMSQASYAIDVIAKLSFFRYDGWDLNYVRTSHSFSTFMDRSMDKMEEVFLSERARFPELETSRFAVYPIKLRQCKKWYEGKIANEAKEALNQARDDIMEPAGGSTIPELDLSQFPDLFGDQGWWTYDGRFDVQ